MQTPPYPKIPIEGKFVFLSTFNHPFDSLIDAPNAIDYPTRKLDTSAMYIGLDIIKSDGDGGAKNGHQVGAGTS